MHFAILKNRMRFGKLFVPLDKMFQREREATAAMQIIEKKTELNEERNSTDLDDDKTVVCVESHNNRN